MGTVNMVQKAPYPEVLEALVENFVYKPGWTFDLVHIDRGQGSEGLTLDIVSQTYNSYHPEQGDNYHVHHYVIVPAASFNMVSWRRWLLDELVKIETHEVCEFFQLDGTRPFAPSHGPGFNPYSVREIGTVEEQQTSFLGEYTRRNEDD